MKGISAVDPVSYALVWQREPENDLIRALVNAVHDIGPLGF